MERTTDPMKPPIRASSAMRIKKAKPAAARLSPSRKQTKARNTRPMPPKKHCAAECQNFADIPQLTRLLSIRMLPLATLTMRIVGKPRDREIIPAVVAYLPQSVPQASIFRHQGEVYCRYA